MLLDSELDRLVQPQTSTEQEGAAEQPAASRTQRGEHFSPQRGSSGAEGSPGAEGDHISRRVGEGNGSTGGRRL